MLSGGVVGLSVSTIYCPVEYAKIQKQTSSSTRSSLSILFSEIYQNRLKNIYKGFATTVLRESIGSAIYYGSYEMAVRLISDLKGTPRRFAEYSTYLMAGSLAGLSYWLMAYPLDFIKTNVQSGNGSTADIFKKQYRNLYKGFGVVAMRAIIVNGVSFATFEQAKNIMNFGSISVI